MAWYERTWQASRQSPPFCPLEALHYCPLLGLTNLFLTIQELLNLMFARQALFYLHSPAILFFLLGMTFKCSPWHFPSQAHPSWPEMLNTGDTENRRCPAQLMPCAVNAGHRWCLTQVMPCIGNASHRWCPTHAQVVPHTGDVLHWWWHSQVILHTGNAPHRWCPAQVMPHTGDAASRELSLTCYCLYSAQPLVTTLFTLRFLQIM